jgi:hypothetical protein
MSRRQTTEHNHIKAANKSCEHVTRFMYLGTTVTIQNYI